MTESDTHKPRAAGVIAVVLTLLGWTSIPLFLKYFTKDIDGWTANGWRYGVSALIWLPPLALSHWRRTAPAGLWRAALIPSIWNSLGQACFGLAPYKIDPGLMTFSLRLQIVFVAVGAAVMFPAERRIIRSGGFLIGMLTVIVGTCATLLFKPGGLGGGTAVGVALSIASGFLYAAYALSVRRYMMGINPIIAFAAVSQYTAAALLGGMLLFGDRMGAKVLDLPHDKQFYLVLSAIIGIGLGHTFYFFSIARLGLAVSASVVQLQPITVSFASYFLFGERLTLTQWAAGVLAIAGAGVILYTQQAMSHAPAPAATGTSPQAA